MTLFFFCNKMDEQFLYTFGLVKRNTLKMMRDRGYFVDEERLKQNVFEIISNIYKKAKQGNIALADAATEIFTNGSATKSVIFADRNFDFDKRKDKMISTDQIKQVLSFTDAIVVLPFKMSPQAKKEANKTTVEIFTFEDLIFDLPRHCMYMPHKVVPLQKFLEATGKQQRPQDLPKMLKSDAISRWFGFKSGSIVQIERPEGILFRYIE